MIDYAINTFNNIRYYYVLNTLLSTIMQPSLNKSIRRSTSSFPVTAGWPVLHHSVGSSMLHPIALPLPLMQGSFSGH